MPQLVRACPDDSLFFDKPKEIVPAPNLSGFHKFGASATECLPLGFPEQFFRPLPVFCLPGH
jgi:hypothetical protein